MTYSEFLILDRNQPAGALVLIDRAKRVVEFGCDVCGKKMISHPETSTAFQVSRHGQSVSLHLELCDACLFWTLPSQIREKFALHGLEIPVPEGTGGT